MIALKEFTIKEEKISRYRIFSPKIYDSLKLLAKKKKKAVIHINATPVGGGVAEMLKSEVAAERAFGLDSRWFFMEAPENFFKVTKKIHNLLQGKTGTLGEEEKNVYLSVNKKLGESLKEICGRFNGGTIIIHDPQPLPLIRFVPENFRFLLRLHIDLTSPEPSILEFLRPMIAQYEKIILSSPLYRNSFPFLPKSKIKIIMPAIDPLSAKNSPLKPATAKNILQELGIDCSHPLITQVSRFDPWKDQLGVIRAYYLAKNEIADLHLVLAGFSFAQDDPEAARIFKIVKKHARGDPHIYLFYKPSQLENFSNEIFINALYTASDLLVQKSIREGFGLTMTEAMWKGKAVVAGKTSGALLQIKENINGILVSSPEEAAAAIVRLVKNKNLRNRLGKNARKSVLKNFLLPRLLLDMMRLYK